LRLIPPPPAPPVPEELEVEVDVDVEVEVEVEVDVLVVELELVLVAALPPPPAPKLRSVVEQARERTPTEPRRQAARKERMRRTIAEFAGLRSRRFEAYTVSTERSPRSLNIPLKLSSNEPARFDHHGW
jgi:hypothetical protein